MAQSTYTMNYSNFIGVDMSSDPRAVARNRLARSVNMWRDYESEQGAAVETFPGFRSVQALKGGSEDVYTIVGLYHYKGAKNDYVIFQKYDTIYAVKTKDLTAQPQPLYEGINPNGGTHFAINNNLYIISPKNGTGWDEFLVVIKENESGIIEAEKVEEFYVPTTYYNGQPYEQRNGLFNRVKQICIDDGMDDNYVYYYKDDYGEQSKGITVTTFQMLEKAEVSKSSIVSVYVNDIEFKPVNEGEELANDNYVVKTDAKFLGISFLPEAVKNVDNTNKTVKVVYIADPINFNTVGELKPFNKDNVPMASAILNCTKSAVYDGRVFLTGNPELPNTVFYSQRNLTGANDPTYFGVYNYFNDGDGNTPNVDLLAMPNMLMVIKNDTVQDGSVYYHVGVDNPHSEKSVRDLVPRIYPSTTGAAGLGSAGRTESYSTACNFLDDPVFLSKRGLEAVSKEQLNAERTIGHRSSNIDRLLIKEDLARASLAEWKGYLVICCNGHIYLADSRVVTQHKDGSYQYEWFYLEDVGTYEGYENVYQYVSADTIVYENASESVRFRDLMFDKGTGYDDFASFGEAGYSDRTDGAEVSSDLTVYQTVAYAGKLYNEITLYYVEESGVKYPVDIAYGEKRGSGEFYGAKRVITIGDLLIFATDFDICIVNTDKRGQYIKDEDGNVVREVDDDKIDSSYYTFNGVKYLSECSIRLDDCDKKALTKNTVYGTTVARFKMMPGSHCSITASTNGSDWNEVGEAFGSRLNFSDIRFDNFSFTENEDDIVVLPEVSRGWLSKQYNFYSDGFAEPFGLYEFSYLYKIAGKIRYI